MSMAAALAGRIEKHPGHKRTLPLVRGRLFPIRLSPDPLIGDRFTIGVGFVDAAGVTHCRLASDFSRLRCLYDDAVDLESFELLHDIVMADLAGTLWEPTHESPSENIQYGTQLPAAGISVDDILSRAFDTTVRFGLPKQASQSRFTPILSDMLRKRVLAALTRSLGPRATRITKDTPIKLPEAFGNRVVRFPLHNRLNGSAADIVSAWSHNRPTIVNNIQRSITNMLAVRYAERNEHTQRSLALFVLQPGPDSGFEKREIATIQDTVDEMVSLARGADIKVDITNTEESLVSNVQQWQPLAA